MKLILIIGLLVYANCLFNPFVFDDLGLIVDNPTIHSLANLPAVFLNRNFSREVSHYYRPISQSVYTIIYSLFGPEPFWYHLVQVAIHIGNSLLIYLLFRRHIKSGLARLAGLVFLVHPINQFAVAYISSLHDVLYMFFGLLSLYFFKNIRVSTVLLFLCLLSKESGAQFIPIFLTYVWFFNRSRFKQHFFALVLTGVGYLVIRLLSHTPLVKDPLVPIMTLSLGPRLLHIPAIIFYYFKTYFFPIPITAFHSWTITRISLANFFLPAFIELLTISGLLALLSRQKTNRNLSWLFLIWFLVGLGIHLQIIPIDMTVSDHFFYSAQVGLIGLLILFINDLKLSFTIPISILIVVCSLLTISRNAVWTSQSGILAHDQKFSQNDYLQEMLYASDLLTRGQLPAAKIHIQKAISLYPQSGRAYNVLGGVYYQEQNFNKARTSFEKSISLNHYYAAYENLGLLAVKHESASQASEFLSLALNAYPNSSRLWFYQIITALKLNNHDLAVASAKNYFILAPNQTSRLIYTRLIQNQPVNIELN